MVDVAETRPRVGGLKSQATPGPVGAHSSVVGADQGFRAPSWDQESARDSVHEDSASVRIAAGQRPRPSFRHPQGDSTEAADASSDMIERRRPLKQAWAKRRDYGTELSLSPALTA